MVRASILPGPYLNDPVSPKKTHGFAPVKHGAPFSVKRGQLSAARPRLVGSSFACPSQPVG